MNKQMKVTSMTPKKTVSRIKDYVDPANQGIILIRQEAMQSIFNNSGPNAKSNEFQVHYWALNLRFRAADTSILDIAIPTCYFNYPQEVTSAHIDFELKDVIDISAKVQPLHNMKVNELQASGLISRLEDLLGITFDQSSVPFNSIHRHPGSRKHQSFSGTDLCKDPAEPGVVYPIKTADNDMPNFAGIMTIDSGICNIAHYEYRTVNGTLGKDIEYTEGGCSALITEHINENSEVQNILQVPSIDPNYAVINETVHTGIVDSIHQLFEQTQYQPSTDAINPANVKTKVRTSYTGTSLFKSDTTQIDKQLKDYEKLTLHLEDKVLEKFSTETLIKKIGELSDAYYGKDTNMFSAGYEQSLKDTTKEELINEYGFLRDCIVDEYTEAQKETIVQDPMDTIINDLASYGVDKSVLLSTPPTKLKEWHHTLTGE